MAIFCQQFAWHAETSLTLHEVAWQFTIWPTLLD